MSSFWDDNDEVPATGEDVDTSEYPCHVTLPNAPKLYKYPTANKNSLAKSHLRIIINPLTKC